MGICDLHTHLLPGIDDGYVVEDKLEQMLQIYQICGFSGVVFTPHIYNPYVKTNIPAIRERFQDAEKIAHSVGIQTYLGSELYVSQQENLKCIPIDGRFALVEFGLSLPPHNLFEKMEQLINQGLRPILAHVERFVWLNPYSPILKRLIDLGCLVQTNVEAIEVGRSLRYAKENMIDLVATDNHGDESLPPRMMQVLDAWPLIAQKMEKLW